MKILVNETEIISQIQGDCETVFERVAKRIYDKASAMGEGSILAQAIWQDVYKYEYFPNKVYHNGTGKPTFEFLEAWEWTDTKTTLTEITKELWMNPDNMEFDASTWKHGSKRNGDARANLDKILDVQGYTSKMIAPSGTRLLSKVRNSYWTRNFLRRLFQNGELEKMFREEFGRLGYI